MTTRRVSRRDALLALSAAALPLGCPSAPRPAPRAPAAPPPPTRPPESLAAAWPARPAGAPTGSQFAQRILGEVGPAREQAIFDELSSGNVPDFLRAFSQVEISSGSSFSHAGLDSTERAADGVDEGDALWVLPDYLAVGTDDDFFRVPMLPRTAQRIADKLDCLLPTSRIVDLVYSRAPVKLPAIALEAGPLMVRTEGYRLHDQRVEAARRKAGAAVGVLTAGHKKDIVITPRLVAGRLAIYGFHKSDGTPIQPLNLVHSTKYVDYAHGVRLVRGVMRLGGQLQRVADVLRDPARAALLSSEGVIESARYP